MSESLEYIFTKLDFFVNATSFYVGDKDLLQEEIKTRPSDAASCHSRLNEARDFQA